MRILAPISELAHSIATSWEPTNDNGDIAANEMRSLVRELPELLHDLAESFTVMAGKCSDGIWMDAGAHDVLMSLAGKMEAPCDELNESVGAMDSAHEDDIERIRREDPRAKAWDWGVNQGYGGL